MYLEIKNLSVDLGEFHLKDINLALKEGEYLILIGPTGSGKSVLLETIIGFYTPKEGIVKLKNKIINDVPPEDRGIGIVYQDNILFPHMNVYENIAYGAKKKYSDEKIDKKINEIAKTMKIDHILHRNVTTLSGGEAQRTSLARALIVKPKIILMDEPFSALDITTQANLTALIKKVCKDHKTTCLHVTHNFNDIWNLADRVGVMKDGEIHQVGLINEVFSRPENNFVADFVGVQNIFKGTITEIKNGAIKIKISENVVLNSSNLDCLSRIDKLSNAEKSIKNGEIIKVLVAIRPESIIFSNEKFESSARNQMKGRITDIVESGPTVLVNVAIDNCMFKGLLTKSSAEILDVEVDKDIYISFKSLNVNILNDNKSFNYHYQNI